MFLFVITKRLAADLNPANDCFPAAYSAITLPPMVLPRKVRAVVFDMDGLLVDTETIFRDAFMGAAADRGHDLPLSVFLSMIGSNDEGSRRICSTISGRPSTSTGSGRPPPSASMRWPPPASP